MEMLADVPDLDVIVVPIGGGGVIGEPPIGGGSEGLPTSRGNLAPRLPLVPLSATVPEKRLV